MPALAGAVLLAAAVLGPPPAQGARSFPLDAVLEYCWNPYYTLPCGFTVDVTLYKTPEQVWYAAGERQGPWTVRPGQEVQLNFDPPYDGTIYRGTKSGGCIVGRMVDTYYQGQGDFSLCPVGP